MSDIKIAAIDRRSHPVTAVMPNAPDARDRSGPLDDVHPHPKPGSVRMIDFNLLLLILLIGVPVLLSCIL